MIIGLYIHIPFCRTRCHYCNFISRGDPSSQFRKRFFEALKEEAVEAHRAFGALRFETLYLGGGTPSILNIQEMNELFEILRHFFSFQPSAEMTCEWNPGDGDEEKLVAFKILGINRISLGVQSFQDPLLKKLGRQHSVRDVLLTFDKIRQAGISNISLDLMLRIPGQTLADFQGSLKRAVELGAEQISLYDLEVHPETVLGQLQDEGKLDLPGEDEHAAMYQAAIDFLGGAGYEHYEISNFAKPGFASKHNLIYWHNQDYLGLGPGAFSYLKGIRSQFAGDLETYFQKCETSDWTKFQKDVLSEEEREIETLVTGLRLKEGVEPQRFKKIDPMIHERIETLCTERLLEKNGNRVQLTNRGQFLSEDVFGFLLKKEACQEAKNQRDSSFF